MRLSGSRSSVLLAIPGTPRCPQPLLGFRTAQPIALSESVKDDVAGAIRIIADEGIGSQFWLPDAVISDQIQIIVSLSEISATSTALWRHVIATFRRNTIMVFSDSIHIVTALRSQNYTAVISGNLLAPVKSGITIWTDSYSDLALLGAFHDTPVSIWDTSQKPTPLTQQAAANWISQNITWKSPFNGRAISMTEAACITSDTKRFIYCTRGISVCVGMAWWKKKRIREFFSVGRAAPMFRRSSRGALQVARRTSSEVAIWTSRTPRKLQSMAARANVAICRIEDGFVRSVGLGSDLLPPSSIVVDRHGIYFDPSRTSDLEIILNTARFDDTLIERASSLMKTLIDRDISKYGSASTVIHAVHAPEGRLKILVPGQVSNDLSIRLGCEGISDNLTLLKTVRNHYPDAYIVFRPHPDVDAGHRPGHIPDHEVAAYANQIARGGSMVSLIKQVDELHTMTSLAGFEALMRGCRVVTYGTPFYAGWGVTQDKGKPTARRTRPLTLTELVAGTLLLYPLYLDPKTQLPCGPELLIERMSETELWKPSPVVRIRRVQGRLRNWSKKYWRINH
ncbi:capsular biosynthesis protein [Asaia siamensis]